MKITLLLLFIGLSAGAQVTPYYPVRTPQSGQTPRVIQDSHLRARLSFWLPYTNSTTPTTLQIDSVGSNVQLLSNGNLSVSKGLGTGNWQYVPSSVLASTYQTISATTTALALKADLASPTFTGSPTAPTPAAGTNNGRIATAAFVVTAISSKADLASPVFTGSVTLPVLRLTALNTAPSSSTASGQTGEIRWDANYMYVCVATNTWKRVALTTW